MTGRSYSFWSLLLAFTWSDMTSAGSTASGPLFGSSTQKGFNSTDIKFTLFFLHYTDMSSLLSFFGNLLLGSPHLLQGLTNLVDPCGHTVLIVGMLEVGKLTCNTSFNEWTCGTVIIWIVHISNIFKPVDFLLRI